MAHVLCMYIHYHAFMLFNICTFASLVLWKEKVFCCLCMHMYMYIHTITCWKDYMSIMSTSQSRAHGHIALVLVNHTLSSTTATYLGLSELCSILAALFYSEVPSKYCNWICSHMLQFTVLIMYNVVLLQNPTLCIIFSTTWREWLCLILYQHNLCKPGLLLFFLPTYLSDQLSAASCSLETEDMHLACDLLHVTYCMWLTGGDEPEFGRLFTGTGFIRDLTRLETLCHWLTSPHSEQDW